MRTSFYLGFVITLGCALTAVLAQEASTHEPSNELPAQPQASTPVWENGRAVIGNVRVDPKERTVSVPGWVNMESGAIELLACGKGGKTHESIFVLDVNPLDLQTGLLLLGLKSGEPMKGLGQGPPQGAPVDLWVEWHNADQTHRERAEKFVYDEQAAAVLPETSWTFTGSMVEEGEFKALAEESLVNTYWDPWGIVNLSLPCGSNDEVLIVNTNIVPPAKTEISMQFQAK